MAKTNSKRLRSPAKKAAQKLRTTRNKVKARAKHAKMFPDDKQAREVWKAKPL